MFPPDGAQDSEIAIPYMQFVPRDEGVFMFFVSHGPTAAGRAFVGSGARAEALCRETHRRLNAGTIISCFGWGDGPENSRRFRNGGFNAPGLAPPFAMEVISVSDPEKLVIGPYDANNDGLFYTQRPPQAAPSWARANFRIRNAVWAFWIDIDPASPIDLGSRTVWRFENKNPNARTWTDNHPTAQAGRGNGGRYAAYGSTSSVPTASDTRNGMNWIGGVIAQSAALYLPRYGNLTNLRTAPEGEGVALSQSFKGNFGVHRESLLSNPGAVMPDKAGRDRRYYLYADMAVFFGAPGYSRATATGNWEDRDASSMKAPVHAVDYEAGTVRDTANLNLLAGGSNVAAGGSDDVIFRYLTEGFEEATEQRFRAILEEESWSGPTFDDEDNIIGNPVHRVVLTVRGVGQWTHFARIGLNNRTYYIESIRGGGRLRRDEWVVRASAEYAIPAAGGGG